MMDCAFKSHQHKLIFTQTLQIPIELEREMALVRVRSVSWSRASSTHLSVLFVGFFFKILFTDIQVCWENASMNGGWFDC